MAVSFLRLGARASRGFQKGVSPCGVAGGVQTSGCCLFSMHGPVLKDKSWQYSLGQKLRLYSKSVTEKQQLEQLSSDSDLESDSDDESPQRKERGETNFWRRKMRTFHGILDINKDGVISYDDLQILVDRFVNLGHLSPQHQKEFKNMIKSMWEERWGSLDRYDMITTEQFLEDMHHVLNDKNLRKKVHSFLPYLFKALDKDKSGLISVQEYKLFFKCLGLTDEAAVVSFSVIDENSDGQLSMKEFTKLGRDFFISEEQKRPSKMFWGPLTL